MIFHNHFYFWIIFIFLPFTSQNTAYKHCNACSSTEVYSIEHIMRSSNMCIKEYKRVWISFSQSYKRCFTFSCWLHYAQLSVSMIFVHLRCIPSVQFILCGGGGGGGGGDHHRNKNFLWNVCYIHLLINVFVGKSRGGLKKYVWLLFNLNTA